VISPALLLLTLTACGDSNNANPITPTVPTTLVETFPTEGLGTLTANGAFTYPFTITSIGPMTAQLIVLKPADDTLPQEIAGPVGLALGTWNGSICQVVLANDATKQGEVVPGAASAVGSFCVRIYDASGALPVPEAYQITVSHF